MEIVYYKFNKINVVTRLHVTHIETRVTEFHIYIYIYICVCVCVCVCNMDFLFKWA